MAESLSESDRGNAVCPLVRSVLAMHRYGRHIVFPGGGGGGGGGGGIQASPFVITDKLFLLVSKSHPS